MVDVAARREHVGDITSTCPIYTAIALLVCCSSGPLACSDCYQSLEPSQRISIIIPLRGWRGWLLLTARESAKRRHIRVLHTINMCSSGISRLLLLCCITFASWTMVPTMTSVVPHARQRWCRHRLLMERTTCHGGAVMVCRRWGFLEANSRIHTNLIRLILYGLGNFRSPCTRTVSGRIMFQFQAIEPTVEVRLVEVGIARPVSRRCLKPGWHSHSWLRVDLHGRWSTRRCTGRPRNRTERLDARQSKARLRLCRFGHGRRRIRYVVTMHRTQLAGVAAEATAIRVPCPSPPWVIRNARDRVSSPSPARVGHGRRRDKAASRW
jgi:hypothetical protein